MAQDPFPGIASRPGSTHPNGGTPAPKPLPLPHPGAADGLARREKRTAGAGSGRIGARAAVFLKSLKSRWVRSGQPERDGQGAKQGQPARACRYSACWPCPAGSSRARRAYPMTWFVSSIRRNCSSCCYPRSAPFSSTRQRFSARPLPSKSWRSGMRQETADTGWLCAGETRPLRSTPERTANPT